MAECFHRKQPSKRDSTFWVSAGRRGCADAGLYRRFQEANLIGVKMFPHLVTFDKPWALESTDLPQAPL
jgi:hypothetical protein